jgi:hypothetical protein
MDHRDKPAAKSAPSKRVNRSVKHNRGSDDSSVSGSDADDDVPQRKRPVADIDDVDDAVDDADPMGAIANAEVQMGYPGSAVVVADADGPITIISSQHTEYDYRGEELQDVPLYFWGAMIEREHRIAPFDPAVPPAKAKGRGREANKRHDYDREFDGFPFLQQVRGVHSRSAAFHINTNAYYFI